MDGANKFVKGDAIAGIIILIINIVGGLLIGRFMQGLSFGDAITIFTTLSIGDGLVAQVPALLIAIASGLVVTKSASDHSLGKDVGDQILSQPRAFAVTSIILVLFGLIPGFPATPFFILGAGSGAMAVGIMRTRSKK